jgi:two-component system phosphate regulon sensor histidine kinase PhoR
LSIFFALLAVVAAVFWWVERRRHLVAAAQHARKIAALESAHAAAQEEQHERLETLLDSMIEGLLVLDAAGRITLSNRAAESLFGFSRLMIGGTLLEAVRNHEVAALAARLTTERVILDHELRLEGPSPRILQINGAALNDSAGRRTGAVLVFHDLTRVRELEGARQEFVANVSHELRTPLSLIKSAAETLLDGAKTDPVALDRLLAIIDRHADRLTLLIDDLLMLARLDSGRLALNLQPCPVRTAAQETLDDLAPRAQVRAMRLENTVPAGLLVLADPDRLSQVLSNLIDNGIKYGRACGIVSVAARPLGNGRVEVCVRDDGPGIPPEARARVFERFYRVDKARSREQGGTGLGLAIVKHVVLAHGGEVRVESELGQGAAFYFTLPAA